MNEMVFKAHNHAHYHITDNSGLLTAPILGDVFLGIIIIVVTIFMVELMRRKYQQVFSGDLINPDTDTVNYTRS